METVFTRSWLEEFRRAASERRADALDREKLDRMQMLERERRVEKHFADERREREDWAAIETALAPPERVQAFRVQLDDYDSKTVEALMENREALDAVHRRINRMMEDAYVLPDGRRVFKTEDGQRVFDEHGQVIPRDIIDPNAIDDRKPRWEALQRDQEAAARLEAERQQLLDYQHKLDEARERLDRGEITNGDLDRLKADVTDKVPEAVRQKLGLKDADPRQVPNAKADAVVPTAALPADMGNLMRQTGLGSAPLRP